VSIAADQRYQELLSRRTLWAADGRQGRAGNVYYRESLRARYAGPYSFGQELAWDGIQSNAPGLIQHDPVLGFDLTMHAGEAAAGTYTDRDIASAPHGVDYHRHYRDWQTNHDAHPYLLLPGRTARWEEVRLDVLNLGDRLRGTGGCCVQDWTGIDFDTMAEHGYEARAEYVFGAFVFLDPRAPVPRAFEGAPYADAPFGAPPRPGIAPLYVMLLRVRHYLSVIRIFVDPDVAHEFAIHWSDDGQRMEFWADGVLVHVVRDGEQVRFRDQPPRTVELQPCGLHVDAWQDNGGGEKTLLGEEGNKDVDQVFTVARLSILG
jgi:hypothetical protein